MDEMLLLEVLRPPCALRLAEAVRHQRDVEIPEHDVALVGKPPLETGIGGASQAVQRGWPVQERDEEVFPDRNRRHKFNRDALLSLRVVRAGVENRWRALRAVQREGPLIGCGCVGEIQEACDGELRRVEVRVEFLARCSTKDPAAGGREPTGKRLIGEIRAEQPCVLPPDLGTEPIRKYRRRAAYRIAQPSPRRPGVFRQRSEGYGRIQ